MSASNPVNDSSTRNGRVRVWDAPTRIFHWSIALFVAISWYTADTGLMEWHRRSGMALLALLLFRLVWGVIGSTTARFTDFVKHPRVVVSYIREMGGHGKAIYAGHNPAGGWMVVTFLLVLLAQAVTGLFANDALRFRGPLAMWIDQQLSDRVTELHRLGFNAVLVLIWLHLVAVFYYLLVKGDNLVVPMFTGSKQAEQVPSDARLVFGRSAVALIVVAVAAGVVILIAS